MKRLGPLFALLAVFAAGAVWLMPAPEPAWARVPVAPTDAAQADPVAPMAPLDLTAVTARPLFDRSRAPAPAPEVAAAPVPAAPAPVTVSLQGVIGSSQGGLTALLRLSNSDELFSRQVGDALGPFIIERIESRQVIARDAAGQTYALVLGTE